MIKYFYLTYRWHPNRYYQGVMAMNRYSTPSKSLGLEPYIRLNSVVSKTLIEGVLHLCRDEVSIFYSLSRLG